MRFLVLGCNGMAGHMVSLYLKEAGHEVVGFARKESSLVTCVTGDAKNQDLLRGLIKDNEFDSVINCIGVLNQFAEQNKAEATYLNAYLPHFLAMITSDTKTQVIHMSTDCVFSGKRGQYTENDFPDGETFYDRSKALGELIDGKNLTLRCSIVGPDPNPQGIGLLNWFMQQKGHIRGYTRAIWTGQTTLQLAKTMEYAARERAVGLYNMVPNESISKYDLLKLFNHYLRDDKIEIEPYDDFVADKSLVRSNFAFPYLVPGYVDMISALAEWMRNYKKLYPHYQL